MNYTLTRLKMPTLCETNKFVCLNKNRDFIGMTIKTVILLYGS